MRRPYGSALAVAALLVAPHLVAAQGMEASRSVAGGGISVPGWTGKIDANEEKNGQALNNAKFAKDGEALHVTTGPAVAYWRPGDVASGNYTVMATFKEPKYMSINSHPHPYGIFIGGNDMGTDQQSYLYCAAYGDGKFIIRGFSPAPFQLNGRGTPSPSVNKAAGVGEPVTQAISVSVKGDKIECAINGAVVGSYDKASAVGAGKLKSTDGVYGVRFAHNTDGLVSGFMLMKQ